MATTLNLEIKLDDNCKIISVNWGDGNTRGWITLQTESGESIKTEKGEELLVEENKN